MRQPYRGQIFKKNERPDCPFCGAKGQMEDIHILPKQMVIIKCRNEGELFLWQPKVDPNSLIYLETARVP